MADGRAAIVTGGLRGLGQAMALGLAAAGYRVVAVGHIEADIAPFAAEQQRRGIAAATCVAEAADLRQPDACAALVRRAAERFGPIDILVNNAGLTFTTIAPDRMRRKTPQRFYECGDALVQAVMDTNFVAADRMARLLAPGMVDRGWGRLVNVTTKLDTMNRAGSSPYGPSKAALEMATEIWAKELEGTGVSANIVNPGMGADTPGMAQEWRDGARAGTHPPLLDPEAMVAPLLWIVGAAADGVNGVRLDAHAWRSGLPVAEVARRAGLRTHAEHGLPATHLEEIIP
jgi:NAD(P)-dependent dehydrogenase (short-subunit alcohol dehydrogenase family)